MTIERNRRSRKTFGPSQSEARFGSDSIRVPPKRLTQIQLQAETEIFSELELSADGIHFVRVGRQNQVIPRRCIGLSLAGGMIALMEWVEKGNAPDQIIAEKYDVAAGKFTKTRPVYPYPWVTRYGGEGDPNDAAAYTRERIT